MSISQHIEGVLHRDIVSVVKKSIGVNDALAESMASRLLKQLQVNWGGREIYIPVLKLSDTKGAVRTDFNGQNHACICKKYDISLSTLYRMIK